jgi:hypothetical protein
MNDDDKIVTIFIGIMVLLIFLVAIVSGITTENEIQNYMDNYTCDELFLKETNFKLEMALYSKCIKPIFPNGYPEQNELIQYFGKMECNDLVKHIEKRYFDYELAHGIYNIKCPNPIDGTKLKIIKSPETWTKSDESSYGLQYENWK